MRDFKFFEEYEYEILAGIIFVMTSAYSLLNLSKLEVVEFYSKSISPWIYYLLYLFSFLIVFVFFGTKKDYGVMRFRFKKERNFWNDLGIGVLFLISLEHVWYIKYSQGGGVVLSEFILLFLMLGFYTGYYMYVSKRNLFLEFLGLIKNDVDREISEHSSKTTGLSVMISNVLFFMFYLKMPAYFNIRPFILVYWVIVVMLFIVMFDALQVLFLKQYLRKKYTSSQ